MIEFIMNPEELERKEKELEERIEKIEKIEKELAIRLSVIEDKLNVRVTPRKRYQILDILKAEGTRIKGNIKGKINVRKIPKEDLNARRIMLINKVKEMEKRNIMEEIKRNVQCVSNGKEVKDKEEIKSEKEDKERRKEILRGEIKKIVRGREKFLEEEVKKRKNLMKVENIEVKLEEKENDDARILFKLLLEKGIIKTDDAAKELKIDEKKIKEWAKDLKEIGIIEITKYPYGSPELKLKKIIKVNEEL